MDFEIGGADLTGPVEQTIDDAMGKAKTTDRIVLTYGAAQALLDEIDEARSGQPQKVTLLHVLTAQVEQFIRPEAISCIAVQGGVATVAFAGGGVIQFDALAWRILFAHLKDHVELETVPIAPPSKLVSQA